MTTVAVLGAGGQIASRVLKAAVARSGVTTVAICRSPVIGQRVRWDVGCDIRIGTLKDPELLAGCDSIVNLAYTFGASRGLRAAARADLEAVVDAARIGVVRRYVHLSTIAVYGSILHPSLSSTFERPSPDNLYGRDKLEVEQAVVRAFSSTAAHWYDIRLGAAYGTGQQTSRDFLGLLESPGFELPFGGSKPSNAIHIDVLANAIVDLATTATTIPGTYNVADFPRTSLRDVFSWHARLAGLVLPPKMSDELSATLASEHVRTAMRTRPAQVVSGITAQALGGAVSEVLRSDQMRYVAAKVARALPSTALDRLKAFATGLNLKDVVAAAAKPGWSPGLFSDPMPGPYLDDVIGSLRSAAIISASEKEFVDWLSAWRAPAWPTDKQSPFWPPIPGAADRAAG